MTRKQLIEAMARALQSADPDCGNTTWLDYRHPATAAITAIEAAGLCIVPREATGVMERAGWEVEELATPDRVYRAMIDAGKL